jgi:predicted alpha-1,6-mannanase (GH76 family)
MDGYALYRERLDEEISQRERDLTEFDRGAIQWGDEQPGLDGLSAGRIMREMALHAVRRRSQNPMDRAIQQEYDRLALARERCVMFGDCP